MANKKISELESRASLSLSDLMAVGDPSTGYLYKTTISDLKTLTGAGVVSFNGRFGTVNPAEGDYTLTQLGDVIITSATNGQVLQYNGSNWVNSSLNLTTTLAALTDVAISSIANNQLLRYNSTSQKWENWTPNYLTAESDTLNSVTGRGNTTANSITVGSVTAAGLSNLLGEIRTFATTGNIYMGANPGSATDAGFKLDVLGTTRLNGNTTVTGVLTGSDTIRSTNGTVTASISYGSTAGIIGTTSNHSLELRTNNTYRVGVSTAGVVNIANLIGTGSRMVVADSAGNLSTQAIPTSAVSSVFGRTGAVVAANGDYTTSQVTEGSNLYYTDARARAAITLTTTGSSGAATYSGGTLNIPTYTLAGLGGQPALNGTGFVKISGTTISYDNSTYLTTSSAASTYLPLAGGTLTGALNGTSASFSGNMNADDYNMAQWKILDWNGVVAQIGGISASQWNQLEFFTSGTSKLILNTSGNLGLGVTPSAWGGTAKAIQIGARMTVYTDGVNNALFGNNTFFDGGNNIYISSDAASRFYLENTGAFLWQQAPSGTAGNAISFTTAMTLSENGNLLVGGTNNPYSLGRAVFVHNSSFTRTYFQRGVDLIEIVPSDGTQPNQISSSYTASGSAYKPLSLSARQNIADLYLSTSGQVGINTTTPQRTLDVIGSANDTPAASFGRGLPIGGWSGIHFGYSEAGNSSYRKSAIVFERTGSAADGKIHILNNAATDISSASLSDARLTILPAGSVGIGTTTPNGAYMLTLNGDSSTKLGGIVCRQSGTDTFYMGNPTVTNTTDFEFWNPRNGYVRFGTNNIERVRITSGGNMEILTGWIKTGEPGTGWGTSAIKIGARQNGTAFNGGSYLPVSIDGTIYYINLFSSTP